VRISAQTLYLKQRRAIHEAEPSLGAAIGPSAPRRRDQIRERRIAGTVSQWLAQIDTPLRVKAQQP
jgi:hypothetical protein